MAYTAADFVYDCYAQQLLWKKLTADKQSHYEVVLQKTTLNRATAPDVQTGEPKFYYAVYDIAMDQCKFMVLDSARQLLCSFTRDDIWRHQHGSNRQSAQASHSQPVASPPGGASGANALANTANALANALGGPIGAATAAAKRAHEDALKAQAHYDALKAQARYTAQQALALANSQQLFPHGAPFGPPPIEDICGKLPREKHTFGEITGYRAWLLRGFDLHSVAAKTPWDRWEPMTGALTGGGQHSPSGLGAGVHAYKTSRHTHQQYDMFVLEVRLRLAGRSTQKVFHDEALIFGEIELWGEVVEHETGYRATHGAVSSIDEVFPFGENVNANDLRGELTRRYCRRFIGIPWEVLADHSVRRSIDSWLVDKQYRDRPTFIIAVQPRMSARVLDDVPQMEASLVHQAALSRKFDGKRFIITPASDKDAHALENMADMLRGQADANK